MGARMDGLKTKYLGLMSRPRKPAKGRVERNLSYGPDRDQTLDLYHPDSEAPAPLVVYLHGGGWIHGQKGTGRRIAPPLTGHGYAVASIGYRLFPRVKVADAVQDAARAIAYLLANAHRLGLDPVAVSLLGHSSGAHIAALLGTDSAYLRAAGVDPAILHAVITLDGVFDIKANLTHYPSHKNDKVFGTDPAAWAGLSPIDQVAGMIAHPRFCLVNENTEPRFIEQQALFEAALKAHGENVETMSVPGISHGQIAAEFADPALPMAQAVLDCLDEK